MTDLTELARSLSAPKGFADAAASQEAPTLRAIRLLGGIPAPEALPIEALAQASAKLWTDPRTAKAALQPAHGFPALTHWIANREGVDPRRIVMTNGGMHGLTLAVLT